MSQQHKISRRSLVAGLGAAIPAGAAAAPTFSAASCPVEMTPELLLSYNWSSHEEMHHVSYGGRINVTDPIFAAIEAHKDAYDAYGDAIHVHGEIEGALLKAGYSYPLPEHDVL